MVIHGRSFSYRFPILTQRVGWYELRTLPLLTIFQCLFTIWTLEYGYEVSLSVR